MRVVQNPSGSGVLKMSQLTSSSGVVTKVIQPKSLVTPGKDCIHCHIVLKRKIAISYLSSQSYVVEDRKHELLGIGFSVFIFVL